MAWPNVSCNPRSTAPGDAPGHVAVRPPTSANSGLRGRSANSTRSGWARGPTLIRDQTATVTDEAQLDLRIGHALLQGKRLYLRVKQAVPDLRKASPSAHLKPSWRR